MARSDCANSDGALQRWLATPVAVGGTRNCCSVLLHCPAAKSAAIHPRMDCRPNSILPLQPPPHDDDGGGDMRADQIPGRCSWHSRSSWTGDNNYSLHCCCSSTGRCSSCCSRRWPRLPRSLSRNSDVLRSYCTLCRRSKLELIQGRERHSRVHRLSLINEILPMLLPLRSVRECLRMRQLRRQGRRVVLVNFQEKIPLSRDSLDCLCRELLVNWSQCRLHCCLRNCCCYPLIHRHLHRWSSCSASDGGTELHSHCKLRGRIAALCWGSSNSPRRLWPLWVSERSLPGVLEIGHWGGYSWSLLLL